MKRFTETAKWTDPWYHRLTPGMKLLWIYLCDNCDAAGVIDLDLDIAAFHIGVEAAKLDVTKFGDRVEALPCGKYWLPKFARFQYGTLSKDCKAHNPAFASLRQYGLEERVLKGYPKGSERDKDTDKVKDKDQDNAREDDPRWWPESLASDEMFRTLFEQWSEHQRLRGYPFSPQSRRVTLQKLSVAGPGIAKAVIERSLGENSGFLLWDAPKQRANGGPAVPPDRKPDYASPMDDAVNKFLASGKKPA